MNKSSYPKKEELANGITHTLGALLSLIGLIAMLSHEGGTASPWRIAVFTTYGLSMVLQFTASAVYHTYFYKGSKKVLKIVDHAAIYLLIAGSYTPFTGISMKDTWGANLFWVVWGMAILGVLFKLFFVHRFKSFSTFIYVLMGWLVVIAWGPLNQSLPAGAILWIAIGGAFYTGGVVFYLLDGRLPYNHAIWHLCVLGGAASHFVAVYNYVLPL